MEFDGSIFMFTAVVYCEAERVLRDAKTEVLVLATTSYQGKVYATEKHAGRIRTLQAIEEAMKMRAASGFRYVYIAIVACASGGRSMLAAQTLKKMGYTNVVNMAGGFNEWSKQGFPVE